MRYVLWAIGAVLLVAVFITIGGMLGETPEKRALRDKRDAINALCEQHLASEQTCNEARAELKYGPSK